MPLRVEPTSNINEFGHKNKAFKKVGSIANIPEFHETLVEAMKDLNEYDQKKNAEMQNGMNKITEYFKR